MGVYRRSATIRAQVQFLPRSLPWHRLQKQGHVELLEQSSSRLGTTKTIRASSLACPRLLIGVLSVFFIALAPGPFNWLGPRSF